VFSVEGGRSLPTLFLFFVHLLLWPSLSAFESSPLHNTTITIAQVTVRPSPYKETGVSRQVIAHPGGSYALGKSHLDRMLAESAAKPGDLLLLGLLAVATKY
jgi:hypothetical protein